VPDTPPQTTRLDRLTPTPARPLSQYRRVCGHSASSLGHWLAIILEDTGSVLQISARAADARSRCFTCEIARLLSDGLIRAARGDGGFWLVAATPEDMSDDEARAALLDRLRALVAPPVPGWPSDPAPSAEGGAP
jgi:hypothetical protein